MNLKADEKPKIWLYAPGEQSAYWDRYLHDGIMGIGWDPIRDMSQYHSREEIRNAMKEKINPEGSFQNDSLCAWQFSHEMKPGDLILVKKGVKKLLGYGLVKSDYRYAPQRLHYNNIRDVNWLNDEEKSLDFRLPMKTMTDITDNEKLLEKLRPYLDEEAKTLIARSL